MSHAGHGVAYSQRQRLAHDEVSPSDVFHCKEAPASDTRDSHRQRTLGAEPQVHVAANALAWLCQAMCCCTAAGAFLQSMIGRSYNAPEGDYSRGKQLRNPV